MKSKTYNVVYFTYFVFALLHMFSINTLFIYYDVFAFLFSLVSYPLAMVVGVLCVKRYKSNNFLLLLIIGLLVLIVGYNSHNAYWMGLSYIIIIGAKDIPFRTIVKVHFFVALCFCLFNMTVFELGMVNKVAMLSPVERMNFLGEISHRNDYGYGWSTDYAIHVFFILLDYWILRRGYLRYWEVIAYIVISLFVFLNCDARMASLNILLILVFAMYIYWKLGNNKDMMNITKKFYIFSVPFFAIVSIWATLSYDSSDFYWFSANTLLTGRLSVAQDAILDVGVPWFGQKYEMVGSGNLGIGDIYNFLDCTYIQSFVIWGYVLSCVWIYTYYKISKSASRRKDWVLMSAIVLSGIAGLIAPYSCNLKYCVLLLACVAQHSYCENAYHCKK